jgi:tRNA(Ile)-lysidine synthase
VFHGVGGDLPICTPKIVLHLFAKKLLAEWRRSKLPEIAATIVAAISGGADSSALLLGLRELIAAKKLKLKIVAAHFNHLLRGAESCEDARFVENLAANFNFEFAGAVWDLADQNSKKNLEQAAREARYEFLRKTAKDHSAAIVLTAHTINDQAETFLLRLLRGAAADGLSAMKTKRKLEFETRNAKSEIELARPLLTWARREMTEEYCRTNHIEFRRDAMNFEERFDRVRVRQRLIPLLESFNPKIVERLANTAQILSDEAEFLNQAAAAALEKSVDRQGNIKCSLFVSYHKALRFRALRLWLFRKRGDLRQIDSEKLRAIERLIEHAAGGKIIELPGGDLIFKRGGKIEFLAKVEKDASEN